MIRVSIVNRSTVLSDAEIGKRLPSFQTQVGRDFHRYWGIGATLDFVGKTVNPPKNHWQLIVADDSDQAGALGYHELTSDGMPLGFVFAKTDMNYGYNWTITLSHELLEMLADPNINLTAFDDSASRMYAYEVCDACEADEFGYQINGVWVSDFVFPGWFEPNFVGENERFDYMKKIKNPFQLLSGGYIGVFDIYAGTGWYPLFAKKGMDKKAIPHWGSRRKRRELGLHKFKVSLR